MCHYSGSLKGWVNLSKLMVTIFQDQNGIPRHYLRQLSEACIQKFKWNVYLFSYTSIYFPHSSTFILLKLKIHWVYFTYKIINVHCFIINIIDVVSRKQAYSKNVGGSFKWFDFPLCNVMLVFNICPRNSISRFTSVRYTIRNVKKTYPKGWSW